jgi:PAS domain S-box-containing protein
VRELFKTSQSQQLDALGEHFSDLPTGPWDRPPRQALLVPILEQGREKPAGLLIAGLNPYRSLSPAYRDFLELFAGQIAAGLAAARTYEAECRRAQALADIDRAKSAFFSNVSHEFRTPLTLLLGPLEEMVNNPGRNLSREDEDLLSLAHRNGLRLHKLVNALLDFSRLEAGRQTTAFSPTDLGTFTAELASLFRSAMEKAGLAFIVDCPPLTPPLLVDREMWEKIVLNLLSNAFKFTLTGSVRVTLRPLGDTVELIVADTGIGIPEDAQAHLFERFYRVEGAQGRTHEGSGIGLALVRELVKLHGGDIRLQSRPGSGSTFSVTLSRSALRAPESSTPPLQPPGRNDRGNGARAFVAEALRWADDGPPVPPVAISPREEVNPKTSPPAPPGVARPLILVAEDNADMRDYITRLLSERFEVVTAHDGQEALDFARQLRPDLLLSDVMMPRLDGFSLLREFRADATLRSIPVILLSARAGEEARVDGLDAGADDYVTKPFHSRELLARVAATLTLVRERAEAAARERQLQLEHAEILNRMNLAFICTDADFRVLYVNAEADRYGFTQKENLGQILWEKYPESLGTPVEDNYRRVLNERVPVRFEYFSGRMDRWYSVNAFPMSGGRIGIFLRDVTEQKRAELALQRSAQQLQLIADTAPVQLVHCDPEHRYKFVNQPYAALRLREPREMIGRHIREVLGEESYEKIRPQIERVLRGETVNFEVTLDLGHPTPRHLRCAYAPERNTNGEIIGFVAAILDITERKAAELQLAEQARLLDLSFDAIFVRDVHGSVTYWSRGAENAYGYSVAEALGRNAKELLRTVFPRPVDEIYAQLHRDGRWVGELRHIRKDGAIIIDSTRWVLDRDADGRPASILETNTDITERKQTELLLLRQQQLLELIATGGALDDCLAALCRSVSELNPGTRACVLLADAARQCFVRVIAPDFDPAFSEGIKGAPIGEDAIGIGAAAVFSGHSVTCPDIAASRRWSPLWRDLCLAHGIRACRSDPVLDADGLAFASVVLCLDESRAPNEWENRLIAFGTHMARVALERERASRALREAKEAAEAGNRSKDRFLAVLSHELRTPLTPVLMAVGALQDDPSLSPEMREDLAMMKRNIELETTLIDDLLDLSRITTGKLPLHLEPVDLNRLVGHVCEMCGTQLAERQVRLQLDLGASDALVSADAARLQQVLWNVLKNAVKFSPPHGTVRVSTARRADARLLVRVQDDGIGIPPDVLPRIFDAFEQGDARITRQFGGLGLGLAISKALMDLHHGAIRAESPGPGHGSTFTVEIPVAASDSQPATAPASLPSAQPRSHLRLLLVEDNQDTARTLSRLLTQSGFSVATAANIAAARAAAEAQTFDVLVSDLGLPDGSGYEVMHHLRQKCGCPGIAMSGYGMEEDQRRSREAGFSEHLVKPIDFAQLIAAIRRVADERLSRS